jgi:CubicO group peptidase (beta-lactamase class C family)
MILLIIIIILPVFILIGDQKPIDSFYENNHTYYDDGYFKHFIRDTKNDLFADLAIALEAYDHIRSFIVIQDKIIIYEQYLNNTKPTDANNIHSASKSFLSALIGIAVEEGYIDHIDQSISDFLPEEYFYDDNSDKVDITIRHLLTMTSGFKWTENFTEYTLFDEQDWTNSIIDLPLSSTPGSNFNYSTGNTYLLGVIIANSTEMTLRDFSELHLLNPLNISVEHWKRYDNGYDSAGCNFFITPEEMAVFGQLIIDEGMQTGNKLISKQWLQESLETQVSFDSNDNSGYGYLWWLDSLQGYEIKTAWGYGDQMIHLIPVLNTVIIMTTDGDDHSVYTNSGLSFDMIKEYIIPICESNKH